MSVDLEVPICLDTGSTPVVSILVWGKHPTDMPTWSDSFDSLRGVFLSLCGFFGLPDRLGRLSGVRITALRWQPTVRLCLGCSDHRPGLTTDTNKTKKREAAASNEVPASLFCFIAYLLMSSNWKWMVSIACSKASAVSNEVKHGMLFFTGFCRKTTGDCLFSPVDQWGSSGVFFLERCSRSSL